MKDTIKTYRENIFKEGLRRGLFYSHLSRILYDNLANFIYASEFRKSSKIIEKMHNSQRGKRCFIIATGPSLNKTNLGLLKNETKVGINTSFKTGLDFDYYVVSDRILWGVYSEELLNLDTKLFLGYVASRHYLRDKSCGIAYPIRGKKTLKLPNDFPSNMNKDVYVYAPTVVYLALQIVYFLGFTEVYFLGCDCDYSGGHFDSKQFADTSKMQNIKSMENEHWNTIFDAYKICKKVYEKDGRKIYNSTVGGKLEVFERKPLKDVIKNG